ncbi:MAG TPA: trehalose-6-phosphate synthase, partial [Rhodanobacteraceae bacterium]|nr:trehalose-6-phosphate synthase [Rhodanobacteraceae bacterium]
MSRLVVVSNRVALPRRTRAGGLASAMQAALAERGGLWVGWSGQLVEDGTESEIHREIAGRIEYAVIDLSQSDYDGYYHGFANRT